MTRLFLISVYLLLAAGITDAQNFFQVNMSQPKCFNACDGSATFASTLTGGPFTAVLTNTGSCPNSTLQSSVGNSITLSGLCACSAIYTVSFFNSSNILVGTELLQVPVTATAPLILQTPTLTPAACPGCCNGEMYAEWNGGYAPAPNNPTLTLDGIDIGSNAAPYSSVCVGSHTLCVQDMAGCKVCTTFSMSYVISVGISESKVDKEISVYPNPFQDLLSVSADPSYEECTYTLLSADGRVLQSGKLPQNRQIVTAGVAGGLYLLELRNQKGSLQRKKIQKLD